MTVRLAAVSWDQCVQSALHDITGKLAALAGGVLRVADDDMNELAMFQTLCSNTNR